MLLLSRYFWNCRNNSWKFLLTCVTSILLNVLFINVLCSNGLFFYLQTYSKCLNLTPCITNRNHMWKYHLIFFFCKFVFFSVSEVLYKRKSSMKGATQQLKHCLRWEKTRNPQLSSRTLSYSQELKIWAA